MLSSSDVAQMFAAQNQMFMGQNQFASQIGVSNPNMSLAAFGSAPRQQAFGPQGTFGGHAPVSYAPGGMAGPGFGGGSRMAGGAMSAMGGIASGLSMMAFDPISAGFRGAGLNPLGLMGSGGVSGGIGAMFGGGIMGGMAAAGATMLPAYAAQKAIGAFVGGGQQQQAIGSALGGFGFANTQSRTGQGFTRDDAQMIGTQVRAIAHIPEMMTSVEELTKLIPKLKSAGVMSGVRDAAEFNSRFKEAVKTLRDVSKVMGTTMEEASQFFEHSRSVGFLGRTDQVKNAMNVQFTAAQTGMSTGQVMQLQQGGAQMAVGRGIRRKTGAEAVTNIAQSLGRGMQTGRISQDDLEDITGVSGEGAVGAAAQQMAQKMAAFAESTAAGRASMMGMARFDDKGKFIGIDTELSKRYAAGQVTKEELLSRTRGMTREQKISASRHVGSMAMEFAGKAGISGVGAFMENVMSERGYSGEAARYQMQRYGFSETEADLLGNMAGMGGGAGGDERQRKAFERKRRMEAEISERTDPSKIMSRIGTKLKSGSGLARAEQEGSKMFSFIGKAYDEFVDDIVGRYSVELSEKGAQRLTQAFQTQKGREDMKALFALKAPRYSTENSASTLGKIFGAAQMGGELMATGGLSLLATGGLNAHGKRFDRDMKSIAGFFTGAGREGVGGPEEQRDFIQKSFKMEGRDSEAINARFKDLQAMGEGAEAAKGQVQDLIAGLNKDGEFRQLSQADKIKKLSEAMESGTSTLGIGGQRVSEIEKFMKTKGLTTMAEAAMALTPESFREKFGDEEAQMRDLSKKYSKSIQAADIHMQDVFKDRESGTVVSAAIASDVQVGHNLIKAIQGENKEVLSALKESDPEKGARALEKALGKPEGSVSADEFKKTQQAHDRIEEEVRGLPPEEREAKKRELLGAVASRTQAEYEKDIAVTKIAAKDLASGMGQGELQSALKAFAGDGEAGGDFEKLQEVITKQSGKFMEARNELAAAKRSGDKGRIKEAQDKLHGLTKALGSEVTERISQAAGKFDKDSSGLTDKTLSKSEAARQLGVSEDDLKGLGAGDQIKLDKATLAKIKASKVGAEVTGGALVGTEAQKTEAKDAKLNKTLDDLNGTMAKTNTLLAIQGGMKKEEAEKLYAQHPDSKAIEKAS